MANKRTSASDKSHHMTYKTQQIWAKNRKRKLERALKKNPENLQIVAALKNITYRRGTPKAPHWSASNIAMAQLVKKFAGFCDKNIFHANKDLKIAAFTHIASKRPARTATSTISHTKGMYAIKARAHSRSGEMTWA